MSVPNFKAIHVIVVGPKLRTDISFPRATLLSWLKKGKFLINDLIVLITSSSKPIQMSTNMAVSVDAGILELI